MAKRKAKGDSGSTVVEEPAERLSGLPGLRVTANRKQLLAALATATQVVGARTVNPALGGVRIHVEPELRVSATDHEAWVSIALDSENLTGTGAVTVRDAARLTRVLAEENVETVDLSGNPDDGLRIVFGKSRDRFEFACLEADGFEPPVGGDTVHHVEVKCGEFASKLEAILPMCGKPALKRGWEMITDGVRFESERTSGDVRLVATNLVRIGTTVVEALGSGGVGGSAGAGAAETNFGGVIPTKYARLAKSLASDTATDDLCTLAFTRTRLDFEIGPVRLMVRFLEGKLPDFVRLGSVARSAEVLREPLLSAARGVDEFVGLDGNAELRISGSQITISVQTADKGLGTISVPAGGFAGEWVAWVKIADVARALAASPSDMVQVGVLQSDRLSIVAGDVVYQFDVAMKAQP